MSRLIPTPNIQPHLRPPRHRHPRMDRLPIPPPLGVEILPKHRRPLPRLERHTFNTPLTLNKLTPPPIPRRRYPRKIRPATLTVRLRGKIHHERARAPAGLGRRGPVVVVRVVARRVVALGPEAFDESFLRPALETEGAGFDALDCGVAVYEGFFGFADRVVGGFLAGVEDCGGLPFLGTGEVVSGRVGGKRWEGGEWTLLR